ncbi:MAG TPA: 4-hydroxythreonine-4-phosphate dehydrogenase PdxA [Terriglobales bacterium]|nr:4-hydroxythreonine-4-phosphate dehydrogenase PdxA [Terriglobales bacterium]
MIAITMGDSSGVGPEIVLHSFKKKELPQESIVIGDMSVLETCNLMLRYNVSLHRVLDSLELKPDALNVYDLAMLKTLDLRPGKISKLSGHAALRYVETATRMALDKRVDAVVTLPVNKEAARLTEPDFTGHTEYIAKLCGRERGTLMLASPKAIVSHVTTHVSLRNAIDLIRKQRVLETIRVTSDVLPRLRTTARIAVAGLNPHAGENGSFGREDLDEIAPAVKEAQQEAIDVRGPFPPDTIFMDLLKGRYDAIVCMYHDQGHIPMKILDFEGATNVTLGLPIVRASVDHGTAFDIAYKGVAFTGSLRDAAQMALKLAGK